MVSKKMINKNKQFKRQNQFNKDKYDRFSLMLFKGERENIKLHTEKMGESMNEFIRRAIAETMERDSKDNT